MTRGMAFGENALKPRSSSDTDGEVQRVLSKLEAGGNDIKIMRLMANSPHAFRPFLLMSISLIERASLPAIDREVIILRLAAILDVEYEWREHVPMSAAAGITDKQRQAIREGQADDYSELFGEAQRLGLRLADEVMAKRSLETELWDEAVNMWGREGAMDAILTIGWWGGFVPMVINCLGITDPEG